MKELIKGRLEGLYEPMQEFGKKLEEFKAEKHPSSGFSGLVLKEMKNLDFDSYSSDSFDNIVGTMKGYKQDGAIALLFHMDYGSKEGYSGEGISSYNPGILTALYSAAVLKRALLPLTGDLIVCGIPRSGCGEFGIRHLFGHYLKNRVKNLKGVILCEPTNMNIYLGHKGRMEYEIVVNVKSGNSFMANRGVNMLGTMFPLIHELETLSHNLPSNNSLGSSSLKIKDVHFCGTRPQDTLNEFKVVVDRTFVPEEQEDNILERAKMIAEAVYNKEQSVQVQTAVACENIQTHAGANYLSRKEIKPWTIDATNPFVLDSLKALSDNSAKASIGYWKNTMTEGAYTYGELGIPTFGFGPGQESSLEAAIKQPDADMIKKAVFAQTIMIHRNIGIPTFGWTSDDKI